jgi:hypothetical protein
MDLWEKIKAPLEINYYYKLDLKKEKYLSWLYNVYNWDKERFDGYIESWGFYYKDQPRFPFDNQIPEYDTYRLAEVRGEFFETGDLLLLKLTVFTLNAVPVYIASGFLCIIFLVLSRNIFSSLFVSSMPIILAHFVTTHKAHEGNEMVKNIEHIFEIKNRLSNSEFRQLIKQNT